MRLSKNFTLAELTKSQTAIRKGIDNTPGPQAIENLKRLAEKILQPVRNHFGVPFTPSSGYRSIDLNFAVGSKPTSQHTKGEAVDFEVPGVSNLEAAKWVKDNLEFDQLILEFYEPGKPNSGWVHVSITANENRNQILTINRNGKQIGLP